MGQYTTAIQKLYVAYFNRPADPGGLAFWEGVANATGGDLSGVSSAFSTSAEYQAKYAGMNAEAIINQIYLNLFGRASEAAGLNYWASKLAAGDLSMANIVTTVASGALGSDKQAFDAKISAANLFSTSLGSHAAAYDGTAANAIGRDYLSGVSNAITLGSAENNLLGTIEELVLSAPKPSKSSHFTGKTFALTGNVDIFQGDANDNQFIAQATSTTETLQGFDRLDGAAGQDHLRIIAKSNQPFAINKGLVVKNIESASLSSLNNVTLDSSNWLGLDELSVQSVAETHLRAASTTNLSVINSLASANMEVDGAANLSVFAQDASSGTLTIGKNLAPTGIVKIHTQTEGMVQAGLIDIYGGSSIYVTQQHHTPFDTTSINAEVRVTGSALTKSVSLFAPPATAANPQTAGVWVNRVSISDAASLVSNRPSLGSLGKIVVDGFSELSITDNALNSLNLAHGKGDISIKNGNLPNSSNQSLTLMLNAVNANMLDDAEVYTKLHIHTSGADSSIGAIKMDALTHLSLAGSQSLQISSTTNLVHLKEVSLSGNASLVADLNLPAMTKVDTSNTTGNTRFTFDGTRVTFQGGSGNDHITLTSGNPKQIISLGAGDDMLILSPASLAPTQMLAGGDGNDSLSMLMGDALFALTRQDFLQKVTGFENLYLSGQMGEQQLDLGKFGKIDVLDLNGVSIGGVIGLQNFNANTLRLHQPHTGTYELSNPAFASSNHDTLNLGLYSLPWGSFGKLNLAEIENLNIQLNSTASKDWREDSIQLAADNLQNLSISGTGAINLDLHSAQLKLADFSGINAGVLKWSPTSLANEVLIKGGNKASHIFDFSALNKAVHVQSNAPNHSITANNAYDHVFELGANGGGTITAGNGNLSISSGSGDDLVTLGSGDNTVSLGAGNNTFSATSGNNVYTGGKGLDVVSVGGGRNAIQGVENLTITAPGANLYSRTGIIDASSLRQLSLPNWGDEVFINGKLVLGKSASLVEYADAVIAMGGNASSNAFLGWFQFQDNTYLVQSMHNASNNPHFLDGTDMIVLFHGLVNLAGLAHTGSAGVNQFTFL